MIIEAFAAVMVGIALIWLVVQPLVLPAMAGPELPDLPDPEETPRGQALLALKEIEFDRATGKLSEADYESLYARYSVRAIEVLDAPPGAAGAAEPGGDDPIEALIAARRAALPTAGAVGATPVVALPDGVARRCLLHGDAVEPDAVFCSVCGAALVTADGQCVACGTTAPADAAFCPGCGARLTG